MLKATFKLADVQNYALRQVKNGQKAILNALQYAGEKFVADARLNGNYQDITGNLRSSVGYVIMLNGQQYFENFEEANNGTDKQTGVQRGLEFALELASEHTRGIALICVAGMQYARYVEDKGRDVITGSSVNMATTLKKLLTEL